MKQSDFQHRSFANLDHKDRSRLFKTELLSGPESYPSTGDEIGEDVRRYRSKVNICLERSFSSDSFDQYRQADSIEIISFILDSDDENQIKQNTTIVEIDGVRSDGSDAISVFHIAL